MAYETQNREVPVFLTIVPCQPKLDNAGGIAKVMFCAHRKPERSALPAPFKPLLSLCCSLGLLRKPHPLSYPNICSVYDSLHDLNPAQLPNLPMVAPYPFEEVKLLFCFRLGIGCVGCGKMSRFVFFCRPSFYESS